MTASATNGMPPTAGVPETGAVQEILHWQATTVGMMYSMIAAAIQAKGAPALPLRCAVACVVLHLSTTAAE